MQLNITSSYGLSYTRVYPMRPPPPVYCTDYYHNFEPLVQRLDLGILNESIMASAR